MDEMSTNYSGVTMNKTILKIFFIMGFIFLSACQPKPEIVDNGNPGSIRVTVYQDVNASGSRDLGELGVVDRVGVGQDVSCPVQHEPDESQTSASGETTFSGLKAGVWCVMYMGSGRSTTPLAVEVHLSSDQVVQVGFGLEVDEGE